MTNRPPDRTGIAGRPGSATTSVAAGPAHRAAADRAGGASATTLATAANVAIARRTAVLEGVRDVTPMVIGVVPFGLAIGAAVGSSSLTTLQGIVSGPAILAGAAQLTTVEMIDGGAAAIVVVLSALMINARLLLYSASIAPWFRNEPLARRLLLAVPVIDQLHFTCVPRFERGDLDRAGRIAYYTGAATWLMSAWVITQTLAIVAGTRLPESVGLGVAAPLALAGLLAKSLDGRPAAVAAVAAATCAVAGASLPFRSAILAAALAGLAAGTGTARRGAAAGDDVSTPGGSR